MLLEIVERVGQDFVHKTDFLKVFRGVIKKMSIFESPFDRMLSRLIIDPTTLNRRIKHQESVDLGLIHVEDYACAYCNHLRQSWHIIKISGVYYPFCSTCGKNIDRLKYNLDFYDRITRFKDEPLKIPEKVLVEKIEDVKIRSAFDEVIVQRKVLVKEFKY